MADLPGAAPQYTQMGSGVPRGPAPEQLQHGSVLAGRYEVRACIGIGGMGAVYRCFDRNRNEEIAIKVLLPHLLSHPRARERLIAEAKLASSLSHPNIVNVFDVQRDGASDFLTMELLQGNTLRSQVQERKAARKPFTVEEALTVAQSIGAALEYAHKRTVHRDLKPENVWIERDGTVKLMDFGIAQLISNSQMTQTTTAMGTAYYMAPEQLRGVKDVDGRADQYALGVLLYELLSGDVPAGRIQSLNLVNKAVPRGMAAAVDRALESQRERRFNRVAEFVHALTAKGGLGAVLRRPMVLSGIAALALIFVAIAYLPQLKALLPDPAQAREQHDMAIQAQGVIETQLKRLENLERDQDAKVRDAAGKVDRYENAVRGARSAAERDEPSRQLAAARDQLALETEVRDESARMVFRSDALAHVRGQLAVGVAALRDKQSHQAADVLSKAQSEVDALLKQPTTIRELVLARGQYEQMLTEVERLARDERQDLRAGLEAARGKAIEARAQAAAGQIEQALSGYRAAAAQVTVAQNALIDKLVQGYTQLVEKAQQVGNLEVAQTALDRAKKLTALKH